MTRQTKNFNPRSREGSDVNVGKTFQFSGLFQSTLPRRERRTASDIKHAKPGISIHAPAKGATLLGHAEERQNLHFNPRSREGSDVLRP